MNFGAAGADGKNDVFIYIKPVFFRRRRRRFSVFIYERGYSKTWSYDNNGVFLHIRSYMETVELSDDPGIVTIG